RARLRPCRVGARHRAQAERAHQRAVRRRVGHDQPRARTHGAAGGVQRVTRTVIAFGSNLGEREATILSAARDIAELDGVELLAVSSLHETPALKPDGIDHAAPAYLNAVAIIESDLDPHDLLVALR